MEIQTCVVCLTNEASVTYTPCNHHVVCVSCDSILVDNLSDSDNQSCVICRQQVLISKYPIIPVFVITENRPAIIVRVPLNATIWDLKTEIQTKTSMETIPRITCRGHIPSNFDTLTKLQFHPYTYVKCIPYPPPPMELLLHRLKKIRNKIALYKEPAPPGKTYFLDVNFYKEKETQLLEMLTNIYGYQDTITPDTPVNSVTL